MYRSSSSYDAFWVILGVLLVLAGLWKAGQWVGSVVGA